MPNSNAGTSSSPESPPFTSGDGGPLCPEHDMRAAMTDDEFWDHVLNPPLPEHIDYGPSDIDLDDIASFSSLGSPCPECGQAGACAYDSEGRALIHATTEDTNG